MIEIIILFLLQILIIQYIFIVISVSTILKEWLNSCSISFIFYIKYEFDYCSYVATLYFKKYYIYNFLLRIRKIQNNNNRITT